MIIILLLQLANCALTNKPLTFRYDNKLNIYLTVSLN